MPLSSEEFTHLCHLAKLAPSPEKETILAAQCAGILEYINALSEVDTHNVEPLYTPFSPPVLYREDTPFHARTREEILANAPETDHVFFIVPKIVEGK